MSGLSAAEQETVRKGLYAASQLRRFRALDFYEPYPKQLEFHNLGKDHDERAMVAGNQVGKTKAGCAEDAIHLTGEYPSWWQGHRFTHPIRAWCAGPSAEKVRDVLQTELFGHFAKPDEFGTGMLPRESINGRPSLSRGVTFAYDTATIRWKDKAGKLDESALSTLTFKGYQEGQLAFASDTIDLYHGDEESTLDIYTEARTRLQVRRGISYLTLTPLDGWTSLVIRMLREKLGCSVKMGIYDAKHYTKEQADAIVAGYPEYIRNARAFGDPALGEGRVFLHDESTFKSARPEFIPPHFRKLWGIDFGGSGSGSHPFGAALIAHDADYDIVWLLHTLKLQGMTMIQHVPMMRSVAANVPVSWPHDGNETRAGPGGAGQTIAAQYKNPMPGMPGLLMLPDHATWPEGGFSTEAAVDELDQRIATGRFKAVDACAEFFDEYRQFHRVKGLLVKVNDDVLSALFKALMMLRYARPVVLGDDIFGATRKLSRGGQIAPNDPFTGQPLRGDI